MVWFGRYGGGKVSVDRLLDWSVVGAGTNRTVRLLNPSDFEDVLFCLTATEEELASSVDGCGKKTAKILVSRREEWIKENGQYLVRILNEALNKLNI